MIAANFSEFRSNLKSYLDDVEDNHETLIIKRKSGKGTVVISLEEYNAMQETMHLLSSKVNAQRIYESLEQLKSGNTELQQLED